MNVPASAELASERTRTDFILSIPIVFEESDSTKEPRKVKNRERVKEILE